MKKFLAVAGNIGVGKSTLVKLLSQRLGWKPFYEAEAQNPYIADFYHDMRSWSFHSQIYFLANRLHTHRQLIDHSTSVVLDRTVYEDAEIFARNLHQQGFLNARDHHTYRQLYETLIEFLPPPDLVVYLRASVHTLQRRILRRGREYEYDIDLDYLAHLNMLYAEWLENFILCPTLVISADDLDFVAHPAHLDVIEQLVVEKLRYKDDEPL